MAAISWLLPIPRRLRIGVLYISEVGAFQENKETWHPLAFPGQHQIFGGICFLLCVLLALC